VEARALKIAGAEDLALHVSIGVATPRIPHNRRPAISSNWRIRPSVRSSARGKTKFGPAAKSVALSKPRGPAGAPREASDPASG